MEKYKKRIIDNIIKDKLEYIGGVLIEGPKWCGKTTSCLQHANSVLYMSDADKIKTNLHMASIQPSTLLEGKTPRLIDEWQIAPQLWDAARHEIDIRQGAGHFMFTGSSNPPDKSKIIHTGTGRFAKILMRTMSLYESGDSIGTISLKDLFNKKFEPCQNKNVDINDIAYLICRGGWPHSVNLDKKHSLQIAFDYFDNLITSDINKVDGVNKNKDRVHRLMRSYARNLGAQVPYSTIENDMKINEGDSLNINTIIDYINALKNIYVVEDMPAWNPNLRSKSAIRTSDNRYYSDPSIATASLGLGPQDLINDIATMGIMFETLCVRDLRVYAQSLDGNVYHYRDSKNLECDCVVHLRNGSYGLIEIKLGGDLLIEEGVKNLNMLYKKIDTKKMGEPAFRMILTGIAPYAYKREDGILIVPITCLKN